MRLSTLLLLVLLAAFGRAQGSAAGFGGGRGGFGGAGGGLGGAMGGRFADGSGIQAHPEDDTSDANLFEARTAILTPGDRVEYKLKVEKGETLFAGVTSDAFDPALSVENASGKVVAKNDDREEGDQAPFVSVRFPEAGIYTLKVLSYKQASGGKFTLKMRTFVASDAPLGPSVHDFAGEAQDERRIDLRIEGKKGVIYDLSKLRPANPSGAVPNFVRLIGPSGVERADFERIATSDGSPVFRARVDGDVYAEYQAYGASRFETDFSAVPVLKTQADGEASAELLPRALVVVEFPVASKQIVRSTLIGDAIASQMTAPGEPRLSPEYGQTGDRTFGNTLSWAYFELDRDSDTDVVRVFRVAGDAQVAIRSISGQSQRVTLRNSSSVPKWTAGETVKGALRIGEVRLYLLRSENAELMRVVASASTFQPRLDIFRLDGRLANTLMDRTKHTAADDLYFPKADTFLVRLSCDGYGGSGEFTLRRDVPQPVPYVLGTVGNLAFDGTNFGLYAVELQAGKRYQLTIDGTGAFLRTDLIDDEGGFLYGTTVAFDKVRIVYFEPTKTGHYRLWLRGASGSARFRLEPFAPPALGGA